MKQKLPLVVVEYTGKDGTAVTERRMQFGRRVGFYIWWKGQMVGLGPTQRSTHHVIIN